MFTEVPLTPSPSPARGEGGRVPVLAPLAQEPVASNCSPLSPRGLRRAQSSRRGAGGEGARRRVSESTRLAAGDPLHLRARVQRRNNARAALAPARLGLHFLTQQLRASVIGTADCESRPPGSLCHAGISLAANPIDELARLGSGIDSCVDGPATLRPGVSRFGDSSIG
jgi:hypothetical protein